MLQSSKRMSIGYVLRAESLYGVSRYDLRPDIHPRPQMVDRGQGREVMLDQPIAARFLGRAA